VVAAGRQDTGLMTTMRAGSRNTTGVVPMKQTGLKSKVPIEEVRPLVEGTKQDGKQDGLVRTILGSWEESLQNQRTRTLGLVSATLFLAFGMCISAVCALLAQQRAESELLAFKGITDGEVHAVRAQLLELQQLLRTQAMQQRDTDAQFQDCKDQNMVLRKKSEEADWLKTRLHKDVQKMDERPYEEMTGLEGNRLPVRHGIIREKTLWVYWYHPHICPSSLRCSLPPKLQLLRETFWRNRGSFDFQFVHKNEVEEFVNAMELPLHWNELPPQPQKCAVVNALLARYGGVALDLTTVLLRPLDDYWDEMVSSGATFMGYLYRLNGHHWRRPEVVVDWFLMARREGIFSTVVRNQVIYMGDATKVTNYPHVPNAFVDATILPAFHLFNSSLPRCADDPLVPEDERVFCPDHDDNPWLSSMGLVRTDTKLLLRDPRDGPLLPFAQKGMESWNISSSVRVVQNDTDGTSEEDMAGAPSSGVRCASTKECWEEHVLKPFSEEPRQGEARRLSFVKLVDGELDRQGVQEMLAAKNSYFYNLLNLSGLTL